jgi:hypothetical protein
MAVYRPQSVQAQILSQAAPLCGRFDKLVIADKTKNVC